MTEIVDPDNITPDVIQSVQAAIEEERKEKGTKKNALLDKTVEVELHEDRTKEFTGPNFARMRTRTDWDAPEARMVNELLATAEGVIHQKFADAFAVMDSLYLLIREPIVDKQTGELATDIYGYHLWEPSEFGGPKEDWSQLTGRDREHFLMQITTRLFDWEQRAQDLWGEAMFAKIAYEEQFAYGYLAALSKRAENDRVQSGRAAAAESRHLGVMKTLLSRKAEALVRAMTLLGQRLKDTGES